VHNLWIRRFLLVILSVALCAAAAIGLEAFASMRVRQTAWNIRGYRGRVLWHKARGEVRVFAVGGSTTYGYTVEVNDTYPAQLETVLNQKLGGRPPVTVANLGHLSDSSVCYEPTYRDYQYLDADIVILYEGYNDVGAPSKRAERDCYQQGSVMFRWTGFFPIAPVYLREKWFKLRYGSITAGYEAYRAQQIQQRELAPSPQLPPIPAYENYERNVLNFVGKRLQEGKSVIFASQPYIGNVGHMIQQDRIRVALEPFMANPRFRYRDFRYIFGGKWDKTWFSELMWLNPRGNQALAEKMSEPVLDLIRARN
jgi:hypothetical protein